MSNQITAGFVRQYNSDVQHLLQTQGSQLRPYVSTGSYTGEGGRPVNQIGSVTAVKRTTRHAKTPIVETPHASRWVEPVDYEIADLIETQDQLRLLFDPSAPYQKAQAMALGRSIDAEIVSSFFATSKTGPQGGSTETFNTSLYQVAAGSDNLTVAKLRTALAALMRAKVNLRNDPPYCAITASQHDSLLNEPEVISRDYNSALVLEDGVIRRFLGFTFIHLEELGVDGSGNRRVPIWTRSGVHLGVWNDVNSSIDKRPDLSNNMQVYSKVTIGATRIEQGKVIEVLCAE